MPIHNAWRQELPKNPPFRFEEHDESLLNIVQFCTTDDKRTDSLAHNS